MTAITCTPEARRAKPHADSIGHGAADAGIDLVEHQCRRRAAVGEHDLEREQKARKLAARRDLHQRSGPRAGIGVHPELDAVEAVRAFGFAVDLGGEFRPLELQRLELGIYRLVELLRGASPRRRQRLRRRAIARGRLLRLALQRAEPLGAGVDQGEIAVVAAGERGKLVDRHVIFASGGAQREQALLDPIKLGRVVFGDPQRMFELGAGFVQRGERGIDRFDRRLDQRRRLRGAAFQAPHRRRERLHQ